MTPLVLGLVSAASNTGEVITAVALLVTALGVPTIVTVIVNDRRTKKLQVQQGEMQVEQREMAHSTEQINAAVNHVGPGEPKMIERVVRIEATIDAHRTEAMDRFDRIEHKLDALVGKFS